MKSLLTTSFILVWATFGALAQKSEIFLKDSIAINGYDAVAYFKEAKAVKGQIEYSYSWQGGKWLFSSKENQDAFRLSPEKYSPQYGGYCAYGTADGHKAPTDPDAWTISDGKLYLNYNKKVMGIWRKDQSSFIEKADKNWPTVKIQE